MYTHPNELKEQLKADGKFFDAVISRVIPLNEGKLLAPDDALQTGCDRIPTAAATVTIHAGGHTGDPATILLQEPTQQKLWQSVGWINRMTSGFNGMSKVVRCYYTNLWTEEMMPTEQAFIDGGYMVGMVAWNDPVFKEEREPSIRIHPKYPEELSDEELQEYQERIQDRKLIAYERRALVTIIEDLSDPLKPANWTSRVATNPIDVEKLRPERMGDINRNFGRFWEDALATSTTTPLSPDPWNESLLPIPSTAPSKPASTNPFA